MDYFQVVVTEFLRARRTQFVNTEYMINLDQDGTYLRGRHWFCDALAIDFNERTVHLCEITYPKTLQTIAARLQALCAHWPADTAAIQRDAMLGEDWKMTPRDFLQKELRPMFALEIESLQRPIDFYRMIPASIVADPEEVFPWKLSLPER